VTALLLFALLGADGAPAPVSANAAPAPLVADAAPASVVAGHLGMLALQNASTTRAAVAEVGVGARLPLGGAYSVALAYRGAMRNAGTRVVGVFTTVHRLTAGPRYELRWGRVHFGATLAVAPFLETTRLRGPGLDTETLTTFGPGAELGVDAAVAATAHTSFFVAISGATRRNYVDLLAAIGVAVTL
jgi:hypothetical protein